VAADRSRLARVEDHAKIDHHSLHWRLDVAMNEDQEAGLFWRKSKERKRMYLLDTCRCNILLSDWCWNPK
jgi:predicted transposase YbfD/YdcC